jgi:hypothetical protein
MMGWARAAYGIMLLVVPGLLLRLASGVPATPRGRAVARILAVRQLTQAALTAVQPDAACLAVGAQTDVAHGVSMLAWAALNRPSRRVALLNASVAALFAAGGVAAARRAAPTPVRAGDRLAKLVDRRDRAAASLARRTLPRMVRAGLNIDPGDAAGRTFSTPAGRQQ